MVVAAILNLTLNLLCVRKFGANGVAYIAIITEMAILAQYMAAIFLSKPKEVRDFLNEETI
jgi:O-antigen/teichoic acid export membrane protein